MLLASPFLLPQRLGERFFFLGLWCGGWLRLLRVGSLDLGRGCELDSGLGWLFSAAVDGWCCFSCGLRGGGLRGNLDGGHFGFSHGHFGGCNNSSCGSLAGKRLGFALTATDFPWVVRRATSAANRLGNDCGCSFDDHSFANHCWFGNCSYFYFCNDCCRCWLSLCLGFCWGLDAGRCWRSHFNNGFDYRRGRIDVFRCHVFEPERLDDQQLDLVFKRLHG